MKKIIIFVIVLANISNLSAQKITGDWFGVLQVNEDYKLRINFHITEKEGIYTSTMDSPDQGAFGLETNKTTLKDNTLTIVATSMGLTFTATYNNEKDILEGTFLQNGFESPLNMSRIEKKIKKKKRPQEPKDFPYKVEEVKFKNKPANITLAGTLTMPEHQKFDKVVVLISGSGPQNRDEELAPMNHRPFLVLSDWLTRKGIAVLRYDDRGVAESEGDFSKATSADFATDVEAALAYLKSRNEFKKAEIGLIGHSEGGMIAPMVASKNKDVDFVVLMAAPGVPIKQLMLKQTEDISRARGADKKMIKYNLETSENIYDILIKNKGKNWTEFQNELKESLIQKLKSYPDSILNNNSPEKIAENELKSVQTKWFRYFICFNPQVYLSKLKCPVLALNGTLDIQVNAEQNLKGIEKALKKAKNKNFEIYKAKGMNHLFQKAKTGNVNEYQQIEETINQSVLDKISTWINELD